MTDRPLKKRHQTVSRRAFLAGAGGVTAGITAGTLGPVARSSPFDLENPQAPQVSAWPDINSDTDVEKLLPSLSNWGRWGADDEIGTLNLLSPTTRRRARDEIVSGEVVTLGRLTDLSQQAERGVLEVIERPYSTRDYTAFVSHGFEMTHLDALGHVFADERILYNGISSSVVTPTGLQKLGVDKIADRSIAGRGVLIDLPLTMGRSIQPGSAIHPEELDKALARQATRVLPGDILFIRTGLNRQNSRAERVGLHHRCLPWLKAHDVALLSSDGDSDYAPNQNFERWPSPMHSVAIPYMGLPLVDNASLDALAAACERQKKWSFFAVIAPVKIVGATGAAVNPVAIL